VLDEEFTSAKDFKTAAITRIEQIQSEGRGNKAVSVNTYLRCLKAFLQWGYEEGILQERIKLSWLKEEEKVLPTFSQQQLNRLIHWKPLSRTDKRLHSLALTAMDTGLRISELLGLCRGNVELDDAPCQRQG
jgi:site-specific recombinase XerD